MPAAEPVVFLLVRQLVVLAIPTYWERKLQSQTAAQQLLKETS